MGVNLTSAGGLTAGITCNDDGGLLGCATGTTSQIMAQLPAGSYLLVVSGCGTGGNAAVRFQRVPVGSGAVAALAAGSRVLIVSQPPTSTASARALARLVTPARGVDLPVSEYERRPEVATPTCCGAMFTS
jgi:hypothetical protein